MAVSAVNYEELAWDLEHASPLDVMDKALEMFWAILRLPSDISRSTLMNVNFSSKVSIYSYKTTNHFCGWREEGWGMVVTEINDNLTKERRQRSHNMKAIKGEEREIMTRPPSALATTKMRMSLISKQNNVQRLQRS
ncbi:hypothetical protein HPP92_017585 [Vanilla planifolia]|uniref:Uncharacterized protein n=1 Tax=Vanilla planifolia TaxID=51239 RepID=A0A835QD09_VANPL|nr:hypothetical protein HPP92_017585 [Vanilla planifolia]